MQHTCSIGTARISYRGRADQTILNITIKSATGLGTLFAPTWDMVMQSKRHQIAWETYCQQYTALMRDRYCTAEDQFVEALRSDELILGCYCPDTSTTTRHCHRYLLADILTKVANHHNIATIQLGELH